MKRTIAVLLLLFGISYLSTAQNVIDLGGGGRAITGWNFQTFTNFTAASDDTSSTITVPVIGEPLLAREVNLIAIATDSAVADVYIKGTHNELSTTLMYVDYADSLIPSAVHTASVPQIKVIKLKGPGVNVLAGCTRFTVGTVFRASGQGTTASRYLKWYLQWIK